MEPDLDKLNQRLKNARALMLDGDISSVEFKEMKNEIEESIAKLSLEQAKLKMGLDNFSETIDGSLNLLKNLEFYYAS